METVLPILTYPNSILSSAVHDYITSTHEAFVNVWLNQVKEEAYKASYFIRKYDEMPALEHIALSICKGTILDIGAGAGPHTRYLLSKKLTVFSLESDPGFCQILSKINDSRVIQKDFFDFHSDQVFDTILLLMNGLGIAQTTERLPTMFDKLYNLLSHKGQMIIELTDYSYSPEYDPSIMSNPEVSFRLMYKGDFSKEFLWLYPNLKMVELECKRLNLKYQIIYQEEETMLLEIKK